MKKLRNVFDQYSQQENHITNAFLLVLHHNRDLLFAFLRNFNINLTTKEISLLTQIAPKRVDKRESIPDGYIYSDNYKYCIGIETKITENALRKDQLFGHIKQLEQYEYYTLIVLTPDENEPSIIRSLRSKKKNIVFISWLKLLSFIVQFKFHKKDTVGFYLYSEFITYMERKYYMTPFLGFRFDDGYDIDLATHYVKRVSSALTPYIIKHYPLCTNKRPQIGSGSGYPWEAWFSTEQVQYCVHPGFGVHPEMVKCDIVLANGCKNEWKLFSNNLQENAQIKIFKYILRLIYMRRPKGTEAMISFRQRHYLNMTNAIQDAETNINIAALLGIDGSKNNEIWWELLTEIAKSKRKYNYQLEISYCFYYMKMQDLRTSKSIELIKNAFLELKPIYEFLSIK
jgi:hypothetical protein